MLIEYREIQCPYCGETFETGIDCSAGSQVYYEDCYVCCRPILFDVRADSGELAALEVRRDDQ